MLCLFSRFSSHMPNSLLSFRMCRLCQIPKTDHNRHSSTLLEETLGIVENNEAQTVDNPRTIKKPHQQNRLPLHHPQPRSSSQFQPHHLALGISMKAGTCIAFAPHEQPGLFPLHLSVFGTLLLSQASRYPYLSTLIFPDLFDCTHDPQATTTPASQATRHHNLPHDAEYQSFSPQTLKLTNNHLKWRP